MKNLSQGLAVLGNQSVHIHGSNILDVSVDDKVSIHKHGVHIHGSNILDVSVDDKVSIHKQ